MSISEKIISRSRLTTFAKRLHSKNVKVVFTNGVFDILHAGHADYLTRSKKLGDLLIVGLNTDASVRINKGDTRPIIPYKYRAILLASLESVDFVVPLDRKTPDKLIELIRPQVLVKGADYKIGEIIGADTVKENGGKVVRMKLIKGLSTSKIIARIHRSK